MPTISIPPYIIKKEIEENDNRIGLEIPDYSQEYMEYIQKKEKQVEQDKQETVIIIDIY